MSPRGNKAGRAERSTDSLSPVWDNIIMRARGRPVWSKRERAMDEPRAAFRRQVGYYTGVLRERVDAEDRDERSEIL